MTCQVPGRMSEVKGGSFLPEGNRTALECLQRTVTSKFANVFWLVVVEVNFTETCGYSELSRFNSTGLPSCLKKKETELFHWLRTHSESERTLWVTEVTCVPPQFLLRCVCVTQSDGVIYLQLLRFREVDQSKRLSRCQPVSPLYKDLWD